MKYADGATVSAKILFVAREMTTEQSTIRKILTSANRLLLKNVEKKNAKAIWQFPHTKNSNSKTLISVLRKNVSLDP